jgi:ArsR family transcriptional regulator, arsenate/arsenite/antimonite-responsive transcriptional repressor
MVRTAAAPRAAPLRRAERDRLVAVLRALADPTRLEIWRMIAARGGAVSVSEVTRRFSVGQPTVSHHLRVLREAGLVRASRNGVWTRHAADSTGAASAVRAIADVLSPRRGRETPAAPARRPSKARPNRRARRSRAARRP